MILIRKIFRIDSETFESKEKDTQNFLDRNAILSSIGIDEGLEVNLGALTNYTEFNPSIHSFKDLNFSFSDLT